MDSDLIIGEGLGLLLQELLNQGGKPEIRISGFNLSEIEHAIIKGNLNDPDSAVMVLVSGHPRDPLGDLLEPECFTSNGRTATFGRNNNEAGLIYFQTSRESDSQSTRTMYHLRDSDFFENNRWRYLVSSIVPRGYGLESADLPKPLEERIELFIESYTQTRRLQLRPFAAFLAHIGDAWHRLEDTPIDGDWVSETIYEAMPGLELFRSDRLKKAIKSKNKKQASSLLLRIINASRLVRPNGAELNRDTILKRVQSQTFGIDEDADLVDETRHTVEDFLTDRNTKARELITFEQFETVLGAPKKKQRLIGTEIKEHLDGQDSEAIEQFEALDLTDRLDDKDTEAAREIFSSPLFSLLDGDLQKQVKRLMPKQERYHNPLIGIIETLDRLVEHDVQTCLTISLGTGPEDSPRLRALFCFLYGPAINRLTKELPDQLTMGPVLRTAPWKLFEQIEPDEDQEETPQDDLSNLTISLSVDDGDVASFLWCPEDAQMWMLWVQAIRTESYRVDPTARVIVSAIEEATIDSLNNKVEAFSSIPEDWSGPRQRIFDQIANIGIEAKLIDALVDHYTQCLDNVATASNGNIMSEVQSLVVTDSVLVDIKGKSQVLWMLGSHPLKLRWFVSWRSKLCDYIRGQLQGNLNLSTAHPEFLRKRMAEWSAHRYPASISIREGTVHLPAREMGGCECYVTSEKDEEHQDVIDNDAIKALVGVTRQYLDTHPFKRDGLHVLFQMVGDGTIVQQFARQFTKKERDVRLTLHVLVEKNSVVSDSMIDSSSLDSLLHTSPYSHFPLVEIRRHVVDKLEDLQHIFDSNEHEIDLAIVPFLFSGVASISMQIDMANTAGQMADPVEVRPQTPVENGTNLTIDLKPPVPDHLLTTWAMCVAILKNKGFMIHGMYPRLTGNIKDVSSTLQTLLRISRQVVTLDIGITRAQITSLENDAPEVVNVIGGIGKNGDYSLVVASNQIHHTLADRLQELLGRYIPETEDQGSLFDATTKLLDGINAVGPQLIMQGAARSAHAAEVLGRVASQKWCNTHYPASDSIFWIALDDHDDWFNGPHADMLRVSLQHTSQGLELDLLVCESKFTVQGGAIMGARGELLATTTLLLDVLGPNLTPRLDRQTWHGALVQALQDAPVSSTLSDGERIALIQGRFNIKSAVGIGLIWRMGVAPEPPIQTEGQCPILIHTFDENELWKVIGGLHA